LIFLIFMVFHLSYTALHHRKNPAQPVGYP
jgi:hypothetical protein